MRERAFHHRRLGYRADEPGTDVPARVRALGAHPIQAQCRDGPSRFRALVRGLFVPQWAAPTRQFLVDQEGGRVPASRPAAFGRATRRARNLDGSGNVTPASALGSRPHRCAPNRPRPHHARDRCGLPAARRRPRPRTPIPSSGTVPTGKAPPRFAAIAGAIADGLMEGGRAACAQASARPWSRHSRQPTIGCPPSRPTVPALEAVDFAAFPAARRLGHGDDRTRGFFSAYDPVAPATTSVTMVQERDFAIRSDSKAC